MTRILFYLALCAAYLNIGCQPINPASTINDTVKLTLGDFYLIWCDESSVGEKDVEVEVTVEGMDDQGGIFQASSEFFFVLNDDTDPDNLKFDIECPDEGTYRVDVRVTVDCASCCEPSGFNICDFDQDGVARYRQPSNFVNCQGPVPVFVRPQFQTCTNCGC